MSNEKKPVDVLKAQLTGIADTEKNLAGLIEKTARIQAELMTAGFDELSDVIGEPFSTMSDAAKQLQEVVHRVESEMNRVQSGG